MESHSLELPRNADRRSRDRRFVDESVERAVEGGAFAFVMIYRDRHEDVPPLTKFGTVTREDSRLGRVGDVKDFNADDLIVLIIVEHYARRDLLRFDNLGVVQSQIESIGLAVNL